MHPGFQRRADVVQRRLPRGMIHRRVLKHDIRLADCG